MNIIIVGCGKIGVAAIESLINEDHDLTVIDSSKSALDEISNKFDVLNINGSCTDANVLKEAGVDKANLFIALTGSDETNILSCYFAKKLGASNTMARIREAKNNESLRFIMNTAQIDFSVNPERLVAKEIYNCLSLPNAAKAQFFSSKKLEMIELHLRNDSIFDGLTLMEARNKTKAQFVVCAVMRRNEIFIPNGNFVLRSGDRLGITATSENLKILFRDIGLAPSRKKGRTIIFGGSRTSFYLAKILADNKMNSVILDKDPSVCDLLSDDLKKYCSVAAVDGSRKDNLREYGIYDSPSFVGLTGMDEENILISYFADSVGVPTVVAKVNSYEMMKVAKDIGIDNLVNPKTVVSDMIIKYARGLENTLDTKLETVYSLFDFQAEALEFIVGPGFQSPGVALSDLRLKNNIVVAGIVRNNETIIPCGKDTIEQGDSLVIVTTLKKIDNINSILE